MKYAQRMTLQRTTSPLGTQSPQPLTLEGIVALFTVPNPVQDRIHDLEARMDEIGPGVEEYGTRMVELQRLRTSL